MNSNTASLSAAAIAQVHPSKRWRLLGWGLVLALLAWQNLHVVPGGIVTHAILDAQNPYQAADQQVQALPDLNRGDSVGLVVQLPNGLTPAAVDRIAALSHDLQQLLPKASVLSPTHNLNRYQSNDDSIDSTPYLHRHMSQADIDAALANMAENRLFDGLLLGGESLSSSSASSTSSSLSHQPSYAQILAFLPEGYSEQQLVDEIGEYLEQRPISALEWLLWKTDIQPAAAHADVSLSGWAVARGLMHYALISDVVWYCTLGLCLATLAAWLALGSWRQALVSSLLIFTSFVLTRGSIPLLDLLGVTIGSPAEPIRERVYFLLVLSALIVSGISLNVRALEAYNAEYEKTGDRLGSWQALAVQLPRFNLVLGIAALNFIGLSQIGIRGVLEVGVLSAIGLLWQRALVQSLLPALQLALAAHPAAQQSRTHQVQQWINHQLARPGQAAVWYWLRFTPTQSLLRVVAGLLLLLATVAGVVLHDAQVPAEQRLIQVREKPIDYLPDTIVDQARGVLNAPQAGGFAQLSFYVSPMAVASADYPNVADIQFLRQVDAFAAQVRRIEGVRAAVSVVDQLSLMQPLAAQTTATAYEHLQLLRWDLQQPKLADSWWHAGGVVLSVSTPADDSVGMRQHADAVLTLAAQQFSDLNVLPFGTLHTYHQTDLYISERKPLNMLATMPMVLVIAAVWFGWCRYKYRRYSPLLRGRWQLKPVAAAAAICLPFVVAYALVVLVMALLAIPLDQATACATALGINAAIDFDLYLLEDFRGALRSGQTPAQALQTAIGDRSRLTLLDAGLNAICFSFLLCSSFIPMQRLGLIMLILLVICAFAAVCLLPAVLRSCVQDSTPESAKPSTLHLEGETP